MCPGDAAVSRKGDPPVEPDMSESLGNGAPPCVISNARLSTHPGFGAVRHARIGVLTCSDPPRQEGRRERSTREPCDSGPVATRGRSEVSMKQDDRPRPPDEVRWGFEVESTQVEHNANAFLIPVIDSTAMERCPEGEGQVDAVVSERYDTHRTDVERPFNVVGIPY